MGIYDKKLSVDVSGAAKQFAPFIIAIIILIGLFLLFQFFSDVIKQPAIEASFSDNPLDLAKGSAFTKLSVTINNITSKNASSVTVEVSPENSRDIIVAPNQADLGLIEKGNRRVTEFLIRTNPSERVLAGTYTINIYTVLNGERFQKQMVLEIKTG